MIASCALLLFAASLPALPAAPAAPQGVHVEYTLPYSPTGVTPAGDVDADGLADLVYHEPRYTYKRVYWLHSGASHVWITQFSGHEVGAVGDFNGDGHDDLVYQENNPSYGWENAYDWLLNGKTLRHVIIASDQDEDEYASYSPGGQLTVLDRSREILRSRNSDFWSHPDRSGSVEVIQITQQGGSYSVEFLGRIWHRRFGSNAPGVGYGIGDVNGDGHDDIALNRDTRWYLDPPGWYPQEARYLRIFSGRIPFREVLQLHPSERCIGDLFGNAILGIPDLNQDGCGDVAVGAPGFFERPVEAMAFGSSQDRHGPNGRIYVFSGLTGEVIRVITGSPGQGLGSAFEPIGDVDGDGRMDVAVASDEGRRWDVVGTDFAHTLMSVEDAQTIFPARLGDLTGDGADEYYLVTGSQSRVMRGGAHPMGLDVTPIFAGEPFHVRISGAEPNSIVDLYGSTDGFGRHDLPGQNVTLALENPVRLTTVSTNALGEGEADVTVPPWAGPTALLQASQFQRTSNWVQRSRR